MSWRSKQSLSKPVVCTKWWKSICSDVFLNVGHVEEESEHVGGRTQALYALMPTKCLMHDLAIRSAVPGHNFCP